MWSYPLEGFFLANSKHFPKKKKFECLCERSLRSRGWADRKQNKGMLAELLTKMMVQQAEYETSSDLHDAFIVAAVGARSVQKEQLITRVPVDGSGFRWSRGQVLVIRMAIVDSSGPDSVKSSERSPSERPLCRNAYCQSLSIFGPPPLSYRKQSMIQRDRGHYQKQPEVPRKYSKWTDLTSSPTHCRRKRRETRAD